MSGWLIEIPAWGRHYVDLAVRVVVPGVLAALARRVDGSPVRFLVHTDEAHAFRKALEDFETIFRPVPAGGGFPGLIAAHNEALREARDGESIALLNADILVSVEAFSVADAVLRTKLAIASVGIRTVVGAGVVPPIGVDARTLNAWCWQNRHPITEASVWGRGRTRLPTVLIWDDGAGNVMMRCFHLCPVFVRKDPRRRWLYAGTIDDGLLKGYADDEVFFVTRHEMAFAEISPPDKQFGLGDVLSVQNVLQLLRPFQPHHLRNFLHRIAVIGDPEVVADPEADPISAALRNRSTLSPAEERRRARERTHVERQARRAARR